jgi:serine phosphatase RsbU (regulator of sigma subunit)
VEFDDGAAARPGRRVAGWVLAATLALGCLRAAPAVAQGALATDAAPPPVELLPGVAQFDLVGHVDYLIDDTAALTLDELRSRTDITWTRLARSELNLGFTRAAVWMRLRVHAAAEHQTEVVVSFHYPLLDDIRAYVERSDGGFTERLLGDRRPFSSREIVATSPAFRLELDPRTTHWVYVRVHTASTNRPGFGISTYDQFVGVETDQQIFRGLYFGMMAAMVLYNLFLFFAIRSTAYLAYVGFVFVFGLTQMALDGSASRYLFPASPELANLVTPVLVGLTSVAAGAFTAMFLDTRRTLPLADRILRAYIALCGAAVAMSLFAPYAPSIRVVAAIGILTSLISETIGIIAFRKGYRPARFFVLAWTAMILGTILYTLHNFGLLPANAFVVNVQRIGSAIEVTLLSFALADRIKLLEVEREQARARAVELDRDLALTGAVQQLFLPKHDSISLARLELVGFYRPAARCGGDWWWHEELTDGTLLVLLADVTGHGAASAMLTGAIASAYHSGPPPRGPSEIEPMLRRLDAAFHRVAGDMHRMTLAALSIDPTRTQISLRSAGAPTLFVSRADGTAADLTAPGRPLGKGRLELGLAALELGPGDRVFAFSDGLPELVKPSGRQLGYRAVLRLLEAQRNERLPAARGAIVAALDAQRGDQSQDDDWTFVVIEIGA